MKLLGIAALNDGNIAWLAQAAGFLALDMSPRGLEVLTATTGLGLTFTTTVRVVDRVHTHAADGRTNAEPAGTAGFTGHFIHVLGIADLADRAVAVIVETTDFSGGHLDQGITGFTVGDDSLLTGSTSHLAARSRTNFDVVHRGTQGHVFQGHGVADLGGDSLTALNRSANLQTDRSQNVGLDTVSVLNEGDSAGTIRIIFDREHRCRNVALAALEVDKAILALVAATNVTGCDTAIVVTTAGLFQGRAKALFRSGLRNLIEGGPNLVSVGGGDRLE